MHDVSRHVHTHRRHVVLMLPVDATLDLVMRVRQCHVAEAQRLTVETVRWNADGSDVEDEADIFTAASRDNLTSFTTATLSK